MTIRRRSGPNAGSSHKSNHDRNQQKSFLYRFLPATSHKPRHVPVKPPSSLLHRQDKDIESNATILSSAISYFKDSTNALKFLLSIRIFAAFWSNIGDCDEVFNYWEPAHYLIYGSGMQTWEYSPKYAIRSYAYIWLHALPGIGLKRILAFGMYKRLIFYTIRIILALICAFSETYFYRGVNKSFGSNTGRLTLTFLFLATGMYVSSTAFLPSTFSMYMTLLIYGSWFQSHIKTCLFTIALNGLYGWPFASALSIPVIIELLSNRKKRKYIMKWSLMFGILLAAPLVVIDSHHYGKVVIAPLNIVLYNVFSSHGANLYGSEPWTFYFLNLALNFNIALIGSAAALPVMIICRFLSNRKHLVTIHHWIVMASLLLWITLFTIQKHKEERFMFPIFPLICLSAGISIEIGSKLISSYSLRLSNIYSNLIFILIGVYAIISISRGAALFKSFNAPFDVYMNLESVNDRIASLGISDGKVASDGKMASDGKVASGEKMASSNAQRLEEVINLCLGKEWHRYPSSFFLPDSKRWKLRFLPSEFRGQLPQPFVQLENGTRLIQDHFNDQNMEETSRYIESMDKCHFIIDTDYPTASGRDHSYSKDPGFKVIFSSPFLDTMASRPIWRSFYVPILSETKFWSFVNYNLLQNVNMTLDLV